MNELVKKQDLETALQEEIAGGGRSGPLLKFDANTSKYTIDKSEVPLGRKFIAHIPQYARGWVLFRDKRPVDYKVNKITEGKPPDRKELEFVNCGLGRRWMGLPALFAAGRLRHQRVDHLRLEKHWRQDRNRKFDPSLHDGTPSRRLADHLLGDQRLSHPRVRPQAATGLQVDWLDQRQHQGAGDR